LYCAESASCQQGVAPLQATAADLGMTVGYVTQISYSAPNFTAQCLAAKEAGVQAMIIADASTVVDEVATDCVKQGYTPYFMELDGGVATSFTTTPGLSDKFIGSEPNIPFFLNDTPGTKTMNTALKKYAASTYSAPSYNEEGTQLWVSGLLFTAAATASKAGTGGPVTSAEILKGLYALHGDTLGGMAPPLTFHKGKPSPVDCWYWIRIQHGKFTTPYGTAPTCVEPPAT
jgi:branched-chain amino acid transport system substrate-binding protein